MIKNLVRNYIRNNVPSVNTFLHARALRRYFRKEFQERQNYMKLKMFGSESVRVLTGPFKGVIYLNEVVWGPIEPKWIGSYEQELHDILHEVIATRYRTIIDIGSAEGFYSVGLAVKCPDAMVFSFDVDPWGRRQQRRLARTNNVSNIKLGKFCTHNDINNIAKGKTLIICDVEGFEYEIIDLEKSPPMRNCDILVEMHPDEENNRNASEGAECIAESFKNSHTVQIVHMRQRNIHALNESKELSRLSADELKICVDERRDFDQCWLWMRANECLN